MEQTLPKIKIKQSLKSKGLELLYSHNFVMIYIWLRYTTNMQCRNYTCTSRSGETVLLTIINCTQSRIVLCNCQPQDDCGCYWCCLHPAFDHQCPHNRSWPDNQCPCHYSL